LAGNYLTDVSVVPGSADAWTVGMNIGSSSHYYRGLVERWSGGAWTLVASPDHGSANIALSGVSADARSDAWAVGYWSDEGTDTGGALIEHWNGTRWKIVDAPQIDFGSLADVAALSKNDVWAVGATGDESTLIEHWDGTSWSVVPSPNPGSAQNFLSGVAGVAGGDVWAVGLAAYPSGDHIQATLIERWDGTRWSVVESKDPYREDELDSVAVDPTGRAWSVGSGFDGIFHTLAEHWDGSKWTIASSLDPGTTGNYLWSVATMPDTGQAIAVGKMKGPNRTLIERSC
jgi:hypothetical protein